MLFLQVLTCLLSSAVIVGLIFFKSSLPVLQQLVAFLIVVIVLFLNRFLLFKSLTFKNPYFQLLILFLISVFIQLLAVSTGSFYSPLLILIHLFALGISFFFNFKTGLSFIFFTLATLIFALRYNPQLWTLFQNDPGPAVLYFLSFFIIIPLSQFLAHNYHFKSSLLKTLKEYTKLSAKREKSILLGLKELIIVTSEKLEIIPLKDAKGAPVTPQLLSLDEILEDKATRIIHNLFLTSQPPQQVVVQIRPITDSQGRVNQLVFLITQALTYENSQHSNLVKAHTKYQTLVNNLTQSLLRSHLSQEAIEVKTISKISEDLLCAMELEDHPLKQHIEGQDVAQTCQEAILQRQSFAQILGVNLEFSLPAGDISEAAMLDLNATNLPHQFLPISSYTVHTDHHWLTIILQSLIDIAVLLSSEKKGCKVTLKPLPVSEQTINLLIFFPYNPVWEKNKNQLLSKFYGDLEETSGLRLGSGLESFIVQTISQQMGLSIDLTADKNKENLVFLLKLNTNLSVQNHSF